MFHIRYDISLIVDRAWRGRALSRPLFCHKTKKKGAGRYGLHPDYLRVYSVCLELFPVRYSAQIYNFFFDIMLF
jgi:hypothetical protein